jgi:hypothetical protein
MGLNRSKNVKTAKSTADLWFSKYVRLRDSDSLGVCTCITCGTKKHWKEMDAGHFISRRYNATRYESKNCHAQCQRCNKYNSGEQYKHALAIDHMYGEGTAGYLLDMSKEIKQLKKNDYMIIALHYANEAKLISEQKGIKL